MKRDAQNKEDVVSRAWSSASREQIDAAHNRAIQRIRSQSTIPERLEAKDETPLFTSRIGFWRIAMSSAAAVLVAGVLLWAWSVYRGSTPVAIVDVLDGALYRLSGKTSQSLTTGSGIGIGEIVRARGGAVLAMRDGSRIEVRSNSELALERAADGMLIHLNGGGVIVTAAKQGGGHLYVKTKDVTVSVVGTVFLVNAEEIGSRVAVIQGEVRVQQGTTSTKLRPGEQVASNPSMPPSTMAEEILWSRNVAAHLALLQQSAAPAVSAVGRTITPSLLKFEVVSIKPQPPGSSLARFGCQGNDGLVEFNPFAGMTPSASLPFVVPRGRCTGQLSLSELVAVAYGMRSSNVTGGPEWARPESRERQLFYFEMKAEDVSSVTKEQLLRMLQTMIDDRFLLKFHREMHESQEFDLLVAKGRPKLKEAAGSEEMPHITLEGGLGGEMVIRGKSPLKNLADFLLPLVSQGTTAFPVQDRTELPGAYDYTLRLSVAEPGPRGGRGDPGAKMAAALEEQLGLTLKLQKVQVETIVIDQAEKPTEN